MPTDVWGTIAECLCPADVYRVSITHPSLQNLRCKSTTSSNRSSSSVLMRTLMAQLRAHVLREQHIDLDLIPLEAHRCALSGSTLAQVWLGARRWEGGSDLDLYCVKSAMPRIRGVLVRDGEAVVLIDDGTGNYTPSTSTAEFRGKVAGVENWIVFNDETARNTSVVQEYNEVYSEFAESYGGEKIECSVASIREEFALTHKDAHERDGLVTDDEATLIPRLPRIVYRKEMEDDDEVGTSIIQLIECASGIDPNLVIETFDLSAVQHFFDGSKVTITNPWMLSQQVMLLTDEALHADYTSWRCWCERGDSSRCGACIRKARIDKYEARGFKLDTSKK